MYDQKPPFTVWTFRVKNFELEELLYYHSQVDNWRPWLDDLVKMPGIFYSMYTEKYHRFGDNSVTKTYVGDAKLDENGSGRCYILGEENSEVSLDDGTVIQMPPWYVEIEKSWDVWKILEDHDDAFHKWIYGDDEEE